MRHWLSKCSIRLRYGWRVLLRKPALRLRGLEQTPGSFGTLGAPFSKLLLNTYF